MKIIKIDNKPFHELNYRSSGKGKPRFCTLPFYYAYVDKLPDNISSIIATSDLQGREIDEHNNRLLGVAVSEELTLLKEFNIIPNFELIISVGDLYDKPELNKYGASGNVTNVLNAFSDITEKVIAVHGNHDVVDNNLLNKNITILDSTYINISNIKISGVSGIIGNEKRPQRKSEENYLKCLNNPKLKNSDIFLLHQTPKGNKPKQIGDNNIANFFIKNGNSLVIAGHCHWNEHLAELGNNQILNTDSKVFVIKQL